MLETMRNQAQSWIAKLILGGIALSFGLWGVGDYFLGSRVEYVAEVDDAPITDLEFKQAFERQVNAYRSMMGRNLSKDMIKQLGLKSETLQTLVNRRLLAEEASKMGLVTSEAVLVSSVRNNPSFQSAGNFDPQRYRILTRNMGFRTTLDFENEMRLNLMVESLQKAIADSARVSDRELRDAFDREYEQRVIAAVMIDPESLRDGITISDAQARAWYDAHQERYQSQEKVVAHVVVIDPKGLGKDLELSEDDINAAYEAAKDSFVVPETRHAREIMIRVGTVAEEADWKKAEARMKAVQDRLAKGENFADVAKATSDDVTAEDGGDLGLVAAGSLPPQLDEALFAMSEGTTSSVIKADNGLFLLQLESITPKGTKALADVHDELAARLRAERAKEEAYQLSRDLDDALGMEDSLVAAAKTTNLTLHDTGAISREEALADALLSSSPELLAQVFRTQPGEVIHITELKDGRFAAVEVSERIAPEVLPFKDVAASVYDDAKSDQATTKARDLAKSLLDAKDGVPSPDDVAQQAGQAKFLSKAVRRNGLGDDSAWLTKAVIDAGFHATKGQWNPNVVETSRGMALVYVQDVIAASDDEFAQQKETIRDENKRAKGAVRFARWMATVRDQHDIVTHQAVLDRI